MTILKSRVRSGSCSDFLVFEVSISNRPEFHADQRSAIENPDKRLFWPPEGRKVRQPRAQLVDPDAEI